FFGGSGPRDAGSKPDGGTGGESAGGWTDGVPQQATMTVHIKLTSAAVREWMAEGNDGSGDYAGAKLKWTGTDGVSDEKEIKTDGIGASDWEYPNIPDSTLKETDVNIPVKPGETYSFTFEWTKRPSVPGYEISANVSMNSTNCLLARSEDKRKSWGASTIRSGSGWSPPDGAVTTGYFYDYYESNLIVPIYVYPDEEDKSGPEKAWQIKVVRTQLQSVCFGGDGNVRIKDINDKFANTTGPFIQAPELNRDGTPKSKAVCYAQGTAPQLTNVTLKLSANIGEDAVNITLQGVATVRGSKLRFVGDGQLKGDSGTVSTMEITYNAESDDPGFTNILPANIDSTDLSIKWTLCFTNNVSSSVDGVWSEDLGTTKNDDLFLIWGKPAPFSLARWPWTDFVQIDETDITYCRLKKICDREMLGGLSLESDPDEIARKIAKVVMGPLNTEISLLNSNGKALLSAWEMLDGKEADCLAESILMKQVLELVGIRDVAQARKNSSLSSTI
ncbi:MAG: hypothetical protein NTY01_10290, partial [Verrucomicrobia bacterium]|nr:hypothetical protein [Verrucomicrobiota bacterium]